MTPAEKYMIRMLKRRIAMYRKSVTWHENRSEHLQASYWLDRIDSAERTIIEIKTGLYQGSES